MHQSLTPQEPIIGKSCTNPLNFVQTYRNQLKFIQNQRNSIEFHAKSKKINWSSFRNKENQMNYIQQSKKPHWFSYQSKENHLNFIQQWNFTPVYGNTNQLIAHSHLANFVFSRFLINKRSKPCNNRVSYYTMLYTAMN